MSAIVPAKAHAELGASSASRWMACPGSVRLSAGLPDVTTAFAQEGTAAHALAELALHRGVPCETFIGTVLEDVEVTEDMAAFTQVYVDECRRLQAATGTAWIEQRFTLASLAPPAPMFGTADFVAYDAATRTLYVRDLKYGQGVVVEAAGNKQLRYYALGALLSDAAKGKAIDAIDIGIVQPRAAHPDGPVRHEVLSLDELLLFADDLLAAARATLAFDAPLVPGPHCRFCKASGACPAQHAAAQDIAQVEFGVVEAQPPAPELLPPAVFAEVLAKLPVLEDWINAVRVHATRTLEAGGEVPGYKLVQKRAVRKWRDEAEAAQRLEALGESPDDLYDRKLKSPAQVEKLVGKKHLPADLVIQQSSGTVLAPSHDPRAAVTRGEEFAAIPAATTRQDRESDA